MRPPSPQPVLTPLTETAIFLVFTVAQGGQQTVRDVLADLAGLSRSVGFRVPDDGLACVAGIGAELYGRLFCGPSPAGLHPFRALHGPRHTAVSTPGDLLFHIRARRMDLCFELAALRTMPPRVFGILMSLEPVAATLAGLVILGELLGVRDWVAVLCIVVASAGVTRTATPPPD